LKRVSRDRRGDRGVPDFRCFSEQTLMRFKIPTSALALVGTCYGATLISTLYEFAMARM
jgi:hypothetical protein